jgi:hypothetical protein
MTKPKPKLAPASPPPRSVERRQLHGAIAQREQAARQVEAARAAVDRGRSALADAEAAAEAAAVATSEANAARAVELEIALGANDPPPPSTVHLAKDAEDAAARELAAASGAVARLRDRLGEAEDKLRWHQHLCVALADNLLRRAVAERALADAEAAAAKLRQARLRLRFVLRPEEAGKVPVYDRRRWAIFDESWDEAAARLGRERANRRAADGDRARKLRDEWFDAGAIEKHLETALVRLRDGEQQWQRDPAIEAWRACRERLLHDADTPLPDT